MNPDDILFAPINNGWRDLCRDIVRYIETNRRPTRNVLSLTRSRPDHFLGVTGLMEAYHDRGQIEFWRVDYPHELVPVSFQFAGNVSLPTSTTPYPTFGEMVAGATHRRSIEDVNLVPNTYTHKYIFDNEPDALKGLMFLIKFHP